MRLINADALKVSLQVKFDDFIPEGIYDEIDNSPTVDYPFYTEAYRSGFEGAKLKIIQSIAEQYNDHNKLVPIWLHIGDIKP